MIEFKVVGKPSTQGSVRAFVRGGHAVVTQGGSRARREALADWRTSLFTAARDASPGPLWDGPVHVLAAFALTKPASAPKRRPTWPISARSGDVDKLARAVLDALTGSVLRDDSQVISLTVTKEWGDPPGVLVRVQRSDG